MADQHPERLATDRAIDCEGEGAWYACSKFTQDEARAEAALVLPGDEIIDLGTQRLRFRDPRPDDEEDQYLVDEFNARGIAELCADDEGEPFWCFVPAGSVLLEPDADA